MSQSGLWDRVKMKQIRHIYKAHPLYTYVDLFVEWQTEKKFTTAKELDQRFQLIFIHLLFITSFSLLSLFQILNLRTIKYFSADNSTNISKITCNLSLQIAVLLLFHCKCHLFCFNWFPTDWNSWTNNNQCNQCGVKLSSNMDLHGKL